MKLKTRLFALLTIWALLLGCLAGCQRATEEKPVSGPASQPEADEDDYPPEEWTVDVYGDYVLSDAVEPGEYPPPTDAVIAEAEAWLTTQEGIVQDFWEKNKVVLENAGDKLFAISGQYEDRKYYYEIADRNLVTTLVLTEDDPEETALRAELTDALNQVSELPGVNAFERVVINEWTLTFPICAFSGTIKVFDGVGCYVSLVYLHAGAPEGMPDSFQMLDERWALLTFEKRRNQIGETAPEDKRREVFRVQMAKQSWAEYNFLRDNKALLDQIAAEMVSLARQAPEYSITYDFTKKQLEIHGSSGAPSEVEKASDNLISELDTLASTPGADVFSYVRAEYHEDDPDKDYDEETLSCVFYGQWLTFDGFGYWYNLNYIPDEASEMMKWDQDFTLGDLWYLSSDCIPG